LKSILILLTFNFVLVAQEFKRIECKLVPTRVNGSYGCRIWPNLTQTCLTSFPVGNSFNWAGFVAAVNFSQQNRNTVKRVAGTWTVHLLERSRINTYAAIFVGIDGFGNNTVEQIGTEQEIINGQQINYAWIQMYPEPSMIIENFPVNIGDKIRASVTHVGNNIFKLVIRNITRKVFTDFHRSQPDALRSTAEWIVEAPSNNGILPLANFGKITFQNCRVKINGILGTIKNPNWDRFRLHMVNQQGSLKAFTTKLRNEGKRFNVLWKSQ
jgi:hypothetical protein